MAAVSSAATTGSKLISQGVDHARTGLPSHRRFAGHERRVDSGAGHTKTARLMEADAGNVRWRDDFRRCALEVFRRSGHSRSARGRETSQFKLGVGGPRTIFVKHHDNPLAGQGWIGGTLTGIYELSGD